MGRLRLLRYPKLRHRCLLQDTHTLPVQVCNIHRFHCLSLISIFTDSQRPSSDGDDNTSAHQMRRITVSPTPSQQNSDSDAYTDDNSIEEVEAILSY